MEIINNYTKKLLCKSLQRNYNNYKIMHFRHEYRPEITRFVVDVLYSSKIHCFENDKMSFLHQLDEDDIYYQNMTDIICIYDDKDNICCTGRLIHKDHGIQLPFEKQFNFNLDLFCEENTQVYEFAHLASSSINSFSMVIKLFYEIYRSVDAKHSIAFAGLDQRLYKGLLKMQFPIYQLGKAKFCMGSYAVPVGIKSSSMIQIFSIINDFRDDNN